LASGNLGASRLLLGALSFKERPESINRRAADDENYRKNSGCSHGSDFVRYRHICAKRFKDYDKE
jgi:hypothetical protein